MGQLNAVLARFTGMGRAVFNEVAQYRTESQLAVNSAVVSEALPELSRAGKDVLDAQDLVVSLNDEMLTTRREIDALQSQLGAVEATVSSAPPVHTAVAKLTTEVPATAPGGREFNEPAKALEAIVNWWEARSQGLEVPVPVFIHLPAPPSDSKE